MRKLLDIFSLVALLILSSVSSAQNPMAKPPQKGYAPGKAAPQTPPRTAPKLAPSARGQASAKGAPRRPTTQAAAPRGLKCTRVPWLIKRDMQLRELTLEFRRLGRNVVIQMAFDELYKSAPDAMTMPMLHYLSVNSPGRREQDFFQALGYMVSQDWLPRDAIQQWPSRVPTRPMVLELRDLCVEYAKVIGK